jgi:hypothetical protein
MLRSAFVKSEWIETLRVENLSDDAIAHAELLVLLLDVSEPSVHIQ